MMELDQKYHVPKNLMRNYHLSRLYLGRIDMTVSDKIQVEERFPISGYGYTVGKLLNGTECQILLHTGVSKSFMSKHNVCAM